MYKEPSVSIHDPYPVERFSSIVKYEALLRHRRTGAGSIFGEMRPFTSSFLTMGG